MYQDDKAYTLSTHTDQTLFDGRKGKPYTLCGRNSKRMQSKSKDKGFCYEADKSRTLDLNGGNPCCNQGGTAVIEPLDENEKKTFSYQSFFQYKTDSKCANLTASGGPLGTGDSALVVERGGESSEA